MYSAPVASFFRIWVLVRSTLEVGRFPQRLVSGFTPLMAHPALTEQMTRKKTSMSSVCRYLIFPVDSVVIPLTVSNFSERPLVPLGAGHGKRYVLHYLLAVRLGL